MHNRAQAIVEYGVILILAFLRVANLAALFAAMNLLIAKIPAPWSLKQIAAGGGHVANLGSGGMTGTISKSSVALSNYRIRIKLRQGHQGADRQSAFLIIDNRIPPHDVADVYKLRRRSEVFFHQIEQIDAAGF